MGFIGLSGWHSDILFLLYFVLFCLAFRNIIDRKVVLEAVGLSEAFFLFTILTATYVSTASYTRTGAQYGVLWRLILQELVYIRKTYGVLELRLVFHFLIKRVQVKYFYGNGHDSSTGEELIKLINFWMQMVYREVVISHYDAAHRVRVYYLEFVVRWAIKEPTLNVEHKGHDP